MIPHKVNDLVASLRNGLGKFQGSIWLKALHIWSKLNVICTLETCRYTWTKRKYSENTVSCKWGTIQLCQRWLLKCCSWSSQIKRKWMRSERRYVDPERKLQTWSICSAEMFWEPVSVQTGNAEPSPWLTLILTFVSCQNQILLLLWILPKLIYQYFEILEG